MEANKYELGLIIRADLDDAAQQAEWDRVKALLDRFGAVVEKEDKWGRRKLAYPIAKQTEGIYTFITYTAPAETPLEIESRLRLMENVLRFMTINMNEAEIQKAKSAKSGTKPAAEPVKAPATEEAPPVVETEEPPAATEPVVVETPVETEEPVEEPAE